VLQQIALDVLWWDVVDPTLNEWVGCF